MQETEHIGLIITIIEFVSETEMKVKGKINLYRCLKYLISIFGGHGRREKISY